jgi:uncharacterized membrane protein YccC
MDAATRDQLMRREVLLTYADAVATHRLALATLDEPKTWQAARERAIKILRKAHESERTMP